MKQLFNLSAITLIILSFTACKKKADPVTVTEKGKVYMEFFNNVGGSSLNLNNQWYKNAHGDSFTVSKLNYYISNIHLNGNGDTSYTEPNSYHLIEQTTAAQMAFDMDSIPAATYTSVTFTIGVDSAHNVAGAQAGALDPTLGMFWDWNQGYIMLKFEGNSPRSPQSDGKLMLHCGGFSGDYNVLKTVTLTFPQSIKVNKTDVPHIHLTSDVLALFTGPNTIDFSQTNVFMAPCADGKRMADDYANMFTVTYAGL